MADPTDRSVKRFGEEIREIQERLPGELQRVLGTLAADAYQDIVLRSDAFVRTGAYRASHRVLTHEPGIGATREIYSVPGHPDPDATNVAPGQPRPNPQDARARLLAVKPGEGGDLQSITLENDRFYASFLEDGTARTLPKKVYEIAGLRAERSAPPEIRIQKRSQSRV